MIKHFISIIIIFFLFISSAFSQKTTIIFKNISYLNDSVYVYKISDYISNKEELLASSKVNDSGYFECSFNVLSTQLIYIPLNLFKVNMYVEPEKIYHIIIPPKQNLDIEDELNPFFKKVEILPGIIESDSSELNFQINSFDAVYEKIINHYSNNIYYKARKSFADSIIFSIEKRFSFSKNKYFKTYVEYKINSLRYMAYERDDNYVIKYRLNNCNVLYQNVSYMSFFNNIFQNYFAVSATKKWGLKIVDDIAKSKSPWELTQTLKQNPAFSNDTLINLVLLKGLNDAFYNYNTVGAKSFPQKQLLITLDSVICCNKIPYFRKIAENIKQKVLNLIPGSYAPEFSLLNQDSVRISLGDLRGKYLFVNFYDFRSYTFTSDMLLLNIIAQKYSKTLDVVTIIKSSSPQKLHLFAKENNYNWQFLIVEDINQLFKKYNISVLPQYYLIDPTGKIILSPSPGLDGNFDGVFTKILTDRN